MATLQAVGVFSVVALFFGVVFAMVDEAMAQKRREMERQRTARLRKAIRQVVLK